MNDSVLIGLIAPSIVILVSIPIVISDVRHLRIPDLIVLPALAGVVLLRLIVERAWLPTLTGAVGGAAVFLLARFLTAGKLGLGDVKYSALIGAALGWWGWSIAIALACIFAGVTFAALGSARQSKLRLPFAPFLAGGLFLAVTARVVFPQSILAGAPW